MTGYLTENQINYVLFHLGMHIDLTSFAGRLEFTFDYPEIQENNPSIYFILSKNDLLEENIIKVDGLKVLFPGSKDQPNYSFQKGNLIFHHDLIKSAFFLLSGYQEYVSDAKDHYGRFPFDHSIQERFGFIKKPIVNQYFEVIIEAVERFAEAQHFQITRVSLFNDFGFLLTHDIDHIDAYSPRTVGYKLKQFLGFAPLHHQRLKTLALFIRDMLKSINPFYTDNPFWRFQEFAELEKKMGFRSAYFFLNVDQKGGSRYSLEEKRIKEVIRYLSNEGFEVGIHGTINSATDGIELYEDIKIIERLVDGQVAGGRQHCLYFSFPETMRIYQECGLSYDSTLGFAAHEGFRNSYCHPFKLYDFENDKPFEVWEFPLNVMDTTLIGYRKLSFKEAMESVSDLVTVVRKHQGLFTLLWHNDSFDEDRFPGITIFYEELLNMIARNKPESLLGKEVVERLNNINFKPIQFKI